jgi:hypothetical protein
MIEENTNAVLLDCDAVGRTIAFARCAMEKARALLVVSHASLPIPHIS